MKVMVFGAGGYIGSRVLKHLSLEPGITVCGIGGRSGGAGLESAVDLAGNLALICQLVHKIKPDAIVNCAGTTSTIIQDCITAHVAVTGNLLAAISSEAKTARFIQLGSAAEYGQAVPCPQLITETTPPNPTGAYGISKLASTLLATTHCNSLGMQSIALRIFNLIGPAMNPGTIIPSVVNFLTKKDRSPEETFDAGFLDVYRDFVHIDDVSSAIVAAVKAKEICSGIILNIASSQPVLVRALVRDMLNAGGYKGEIREALSNPRSRAVVWQHADINAAAKILGWYPRINIHKIALSYAEEARLSVKST